MKPRWKTVVEILVGFLLLIVYGVIWNNHINDEIPFNIIWGIIGLVVGVRGIDLIINGWKEL